AAAATLAEAARVAVDLAGARPAGPVAAGDGAALAPRAGELARRLGGGRWAIRGLYSGGTLCKEAALIVGDLLPGHGAGHTLLDLGADEFTVRRPHPLIHFRPPHD